MGPNLNRLIQRGRVILRDRWARRIRQRLIAMRSFAGLDGRDRVAFRRFFAGRPGSWERLLSRLDHAAERINPFLVVIALGLLVLDASCLISLLDTGGLAVHQGAAGPPMTASTTDTMPN
jgi:hypothetical protein